MKMILKAFPLPSRLKFQEPMSDLEIMQFCSDNEIVDLERGADGWLELRPLAGVRAGEIILKINQQLQFWNSACGEEKGAVVSRVGYTLPDGSLRCPPISWIEPSVWKALIRRSEDRFAVGPPHFLFEIVSLSRSLATLHAKMPLWIANGVKLAWLIDPDRRSVSIYRPGEKTETTKESRLQGEGLMASFVLDLDKIW